MSLPEINWERVAEAALGDMGDTYSFDLEDILEAVLKAAQRYLAADLVEVQISGTESLFEFPFHGRKRKGYVDLWGWKEGYLWLVDWKSTGTLDDKWKWREENSTQGLFYAHALMALAKLPAQPVFYECRGVDREGHQKQVSLVFSLENLTGFDCQAAGWEALFHSCWENAEGLEKEWPRNKPEGCRPFGPRYPCQYENMCAGKVETLSHNAPWNALPASSYTRDKEFRRCPERWRLLTIDSLLKRTKEDSPEAEWGNAFHRGIGEIYKQQIGEKE